MPKPITRFAPSTTGHLHLGSLCTALGSYCYIKQRGGVWLVRLEDTDFERCHAHYGRSIVEDLRQLGFDFEAPLWQSAYLKRYEDALNTLGQKNLLYPCALSRKDLKTQVSTPKARPYAVDMRVKWRLILPNAMHAFCDLRLGNVHQNPYRCLGNPVLKRQNQVINYLLASVVDDVANGVTHVVRGMDLVELTAGQNVLWEAFDTPPPKYLHLPIITHKGQKLSKQNLATPIGQIPHALDAAWELLGQTPMPSAPLDARIAAFDLAQVAKHAIGIQALSNCERLG